MVWDYNRDTKRFTIRFMPNGEWECDDIGVTWQELLGETPCLASAGERAAWSQPELLDFSVDELTPQPITSIPKVTELCIRCSRNKAFTISRHCEL